MDTFRGGSLKWLYVLHSLHSFYCLVWGGFVFSCLWYLVCFWVY